MILEPRNKHSVKPDAAYRHIEAMYPALSKIELFARRRCPGWMSWGLELEDDEPAAAQARGT